MTQVEQAQADLDYVRQAVLRRERNPRGYEAIYIVWAVYTLIGYTLIDFRPHAADLFFLAGWPIAGGFSAWIGKRLRQQVGEIDGDLNRRQGIHWGGGAILIIACCVIMQTLYPATRNVIGGQICVEMFGLLYFLAGVHFERHFLWLGPVLMAGGLAVGKVHVYPWTCLGLVLAAGLCVPYLARRWRHG